MRLDRTAHRFDIDHAVAHHASVLVAETDIADEIVVCLAVGRDSVGGEAVIGIAHGDARHDDLILRDVCDLSNDIRSGDPPDH